VAHFYGVGAQGGHLAAACRSPNAWWIADTGRSMSVNPGADRAQIDLVVHGRVRDRAAPAMLGNWISCGSLIRWMRPPPRENPGPPPPGVFWEKKKKDFTKRARVIARSAHQYGNPAAAIFEFRVRLRRDHPAVGSPARWRVRTPGYNYLRYANGRSGSRGATRHR